MLAVTNCVINESKIELLTALYSKTKSVVHNILWTKSQSGDRALCGLSEHLEVSQIHEHSCQLQTQPETLPFTFHLTDCILIF